MNPHFKIDILLSTYNGEAYISGLLESIIDQSLTDWRLLIRDDGSQDKTPAILSEYCKNYPDKIVIISQQEGNLGPMLSFGKLMEYSTAPYVMFCDQDDVWLKEKIQVSFDKLLELEEKFGYNKPLLVYTDSFLTDKGLNVISGSTQQSAGFDDPQAVKFRNLILRSVIFGNTMIINRSLLKLTSPIPKNAFMHDWWVTIVASGAGHIEYIPKPTLFYRQHDQNVAGFRRIRLSKILSNFYKEYKIYYQRQDRIMQQIKAFYERLGPSLENKHLPDEVTLVSPLAGLEKLGYWQRKFFLLNFYKKCIYRTKALVDLVFYFKIYK